MLATLGQVQRSSSGPVDSHTTDYRKSDTTYNTTMGFIKVFLQERLSKSTHLIEVL
jgi:hypothetical protein